MACALSHPCATFLPGKLSYKASYYKEIDLMQVKNRGAVFVSLCNYVDHALSLSAVVETRSDVRCNRSISESVRR